MRSTLAFIRKEFCEHIRSGKLVFLGLVFLLLGIMNPAVAKLTPWLLEMFSDSFAESGILIGEVTVTARDSWVQFYKNAPMGLVAFILLESGIFTREYSTGTLILSLTKGLRRYRVILSKALVLLSLWTAAYWLSYLVTYGYTAYFFDMSVVQSPHLAAAGYWLFGVWVVALLCFFSVLSTSYAVVLLGTGGAALFVYFVGLIPKVGRYLPTYLTDGTPLLYGTAEADSYLAPMLVTAGLALALFAACIPVFNKRDL